MLRGLFVFMTIAITVQCYCFKTITIYLLLCRRIS